MKPASRVMLSIFLQCVKYPMKVRYRSKKDQVTKEYVQLFCRSCFHSLVEVAALCHCSAKKQEGFVDQ